MFAPETPLLLGSLCFKIEVDDNDESHRVVVATLLLGPFTAAHADALNVKSLIFETSTGTPKEAIETLVLNLTIPDQRLAIALTPDGVPRIVLPSVRIEEKLRARIKHDRDPVECEATLKISALYPSAETLLALASAVNDTLYCTFSPVQGDLLTAQDDGEPIRHVESSRVN